MTEQENRARFRQAVDHTLSGIEGDPFLAQRVMANARKGEKTMKYRIPRGLVIALLVLLCMGTVAVAAVLVNYSPEMRAQKQAMEALCGKYGLTRSSLGLFTVTYAEDEQGVHVWYRANSYLPTERIGDYHVLIAEDKAEVSWTHDDKERILWDSGDPESPYWGEKQLQAYLHAENPHEWLQTYLAPAKEEADLPNFYDTLDFVVVEQETGDMPFRDAQDLADAALMDFYGMTEKEVASYDHFLDPRILLCADGRRLWEVTIAGEEICFQILVDTQTGEIVHIMVTTGGVG